MATTVTITIVINDESAAKSWRDQVEQINEDYKRAMEEAGQTLEEMSNMMDGTLVDEFAKYGGQIIDAAQKTYEAMNEIVQTVNKILDTVTGFMDDAIGGLGKLVSKVFN